MKALALLIVSILGLGYGQAYAEKSDYTPRLECKHQVRVEIYEKRLERDKNEYDG